MSDHTKTAAPRIAAGDAAESATGICGGRRATEDGLYQVGRGRKSCHFYAKDGVLWLPTTIAHPLLWLVGSCNILGVGNRFFVRAADAIRELPQHAGAFRALADRHGLSVGEESSGRNPRHKPNAAKAALDAAKEAKP
jgi:hypothetical protein